VDDAVAKLDRGEYLQYTLPPQPAAPMAGRQAREAAAVRSAAIAERVGPGLDRRPRAIAVQFGWKTTDSFGRAAKPLPLPDESHTRLTVCDPAGTGKWRTVAMTPANPGWGAAYCE
jgi:hypothetical protein